LRPSIAEPMPTRAGTSGGDPAIRLDVVYPDARGLWAILRAMRRSLLTVVLAICVVWQTSAFAFFGSAGVVPSGEMGHERMHLEMLPHHHAADGTIQFDDSAASLLHVMADSAASAALLIDAPVRLLSTAGTPPAAKRHRTPPLPFLDAPLRPPEPSV